MKIECFPKDFIIKTSRTAYFDYLKVTDFTIKAIKIKNTSEHQIELISLRYTLKGSDQLVQTIIYDESALQQKINHFSQMAKRMLTKKDGFKEGLRIGNLQKLFGTESIWDENQVSFSTTLNPQEELGIITEQFIIHTNRLIDQLTIQLDYLSQKKTETVEITVPLLEYQVKNDYTFPVKGKWHVIGSFDDYITGHRIMHSQEFAFDLDKLPETEPLPQKEKNNAYPCYGEKIYAAAGGKVIHLNSEMPENPTAGSDLEVSELETLWEKFGYEPLGPGNFIVIKHKYNEYSLYAHLIPSSIKVRIDDMVKQGQFLGLVGNSGNSDGPHLHFQLMKGSSTQTGRGLPCTFTNLRDCYGNKIQFPSITSQIVYAD